MRNLRALAGAAAFVIGVTGAALADIEFDEDVTPDVIFGSGNDNGAFTTDCRNGIEIGLRGKVRFDVPLNVFNSGGDGTYSFDAGYATTGFWWDQPSTSTPLWNFEWTVNTDFDDTSGLVLNDLTYELGLDFDPSLGTNFLQFDLITPSVFVPVFDHSIGDNSTTDATDSIASDATNYSTLLSANNVAQNSWNYEFFDNSPFDIFDPTVVGTYAIYLLAKDANGNVVAKSDIQILVGGHYRLARN